MAPHSFNARSIIFGSAAAVALASLGGVTAQAGETQTGTNNCTSFGASAQDSSCQNIYVNGLDDFCIFGPPSTGETVGQFERKSVAWCTKAGHGTRLIPEGTFTGVHFVETDAYVQITGKGDLTKINMEKGDYGGELDYSGADGLGNPVGGTAYTTQVGNGKKATEVKHWISFISDTQFCLRVCKPAAKGSKGPGPMQWCEHKYDAMGCQWNIPAAYDDGFDSCESEPGIPQGLYPSGKTTSTYEREASPTPLAHPAPAKSKCTTVDALVYATAKSAVKSHNSTSHNSTEEGDVATDPFNTDVGTTGHAQALVVGSIFTSTSFFISLALVLAS